MKEEIIPKKQPRMSLPMHSLPLMYKNDDKKKKVGLSIYIWRNNDETFHHHAQSLYQSSCSSALIF